MCTAFLEDTELCSSASHVPSKEVLQPRNVGKSCDAVPKYCSFRSHPGMCLTGVKRFYWDRRSNKCRQFHYNGSFGNANRFETFDECRRACDIRREYKPVYR
ncbi:kunitz-type serine protease inhibitor 2-like [Dermacentor andersoni]|uniref:kunitz-type serine protease inhibitor 2-like n=1 Tax=Dermacentor andersoni TaxID=34620 RepID=UPI002416D1D0|nr:kunitz-type serine protease inhibitor dendrotoxin DaE1-like isoform X1 [Dermacentor andersoni]